MVLERNRVSHICTSDLPRNSPAVPKTSSTQAARLDEEHLSANDHWWKEEVSLEFVCETGEIDG